MSCQISTCLNIDNAPPANNVKSLLKRQGQCCGVISKNCTLCNCLLEPSDSSYVYTNAVRTDSVRRDNSVVSNVPLVYTNENVYTNGSAMINGKYERREVERRIPSNPNYYNKASPAYNPKEQFCQGYTY